MSEPSPVVTLADPYTVVEGGGDVGPNIITVTNEASSDLYLFSPTVSPADFDVEMAGISFIPPGETVMGHVEGRVTERVDVIIVIPHALSDGSGTHPGEPTGWSELSWSIEVVPDLPREEVPPPVRVLVFSKTTEAVGGGSETVSSDIPLNVLDGIDPDELAKDLIPAYEDAGWEFKHLRVTTQHVETYDPRN